MAEIIPIGYLYEAKGKSMDECEPFFNAKVIELEKNIPRAIDRLVQKLLIKMDDLKGEERENPFYYEPFTIEMARIVDLVERYGGKKLQNKLPMITINYILEFQDFFGIRRKIL